MTETTPTNWYAELHATFGDRLEAARNAAGMTTAGLAAVLGVQKKTIEAWEADRSEPRANRLQMLAGAVGVPLVWLMTGAGEVPRTVDAEPLPESARAALDELAQLRRSALALAEEAVQMEQRVRSLLQENAA